MIPLFPSTFSHEPTKKHVAVETFQAQKKYDDFYMIIKDVFTFQGLQWKSHSTAYSWISE